MDTEMQAVYTPENEEELNTNHVQKAADSQPKCDENTAPYLAKIEDTISTLNNSNALLKRATEEINASVEKINANESHVKAILASCTECILRITNMESELKILNANCAVNQELIKANLHLNAVCQEQVIPALPPLKLETKLKVKVEEYGEALLLLGQTFDIKDRLKEIAGARYNSAPPEKKGWLVPKDKLDLVKNELLDLCEFDDSAIA